MGGLHRFYRRYLFFAITSGWLARSHWVAYVDFIGFICYIQWVLCADPLTLCVLASWWLAQFHLVLLVLLVLPVGGLGVASGWYTQFLLLFLFFSFSTARFGQRLA